MPVIGTYMVPHPPIILPEVGKGEEKKIQKTLDAYEEVGRRIGQLKPDTIVIASPHAHMYLDYLQISTGEGDKGSMEEFGVPELTFDEKYDTEMVDRISQLASESGLAAGELGDQTNDLDHGCMVPLYFIRKYLPEFQLIRLGLSGLPLEDHYKLGMLVKQAAEELDRRIVFIGSGDLAHKFNEASPYGFDPAGPEYDDRIMEVMGSADFLKLFAFDKNFCEKAAECGHKSFVMMAGSLDRTAVKAETLSHEGTFGIGYGIVCYEPGEPDDSRAFLMEQDTMERQRLAARREMEDAYVKLARQSIEAVVGGKGALPEPSDLLEELTGRKAGAFVSIHKKGDLRGCIGTIQPTYESIAKEIINNAISASISDPRFSPIDASELDDLEITVDILGEIEEIFTPADLDPARYGVIVSRDSRKGLLLPNLDGIDSAEMQIRIALQKAGIAQDEEIKLERFEVVRHY